MPDDTTRFMCKGKPIHHYMGTSTFSEYTVVLAISLVRVPKDVPLDRVCLLACGITTGYGAAINTANVQPQSICIIFGLGAVGLSVIQGCKRNGAG